MIIGIAKGSLHMNNSHIFQRDCHKRHSFLIMAEYKPIWVEILINAFHSGSLTF